MNCAKKLILSRKVMLLFEIRAPKLEYEITGACFRPHFRYFHRENRLNRMADGEDGNTVKYSALRAMKITSGATDDTKRRNIEDSDDPDSFFSITEGLSKLPSTEEDEYRVKALLNEILTLRNTNISSWIIESKVKNLCAAYKCLLKPHRYGFLKALSTEHSVDHTAVRKAAECLPSSETSCDTAQILKAEERLRNFLTPPYSWLFTHVSRLETGVKFLVDLRTDILSLISETEVGNPLLPSLQQLNITLKEMLALWFSVGFLKLERITWRSPCEMLQKISEYEAVHPVRSWTDLKRRVGPYRRCFVYTHTSMPFEPIVVLHTALSDNIASSMRGIVSAAARMSIDASASATGIGHTECEDPSSIKAAIFYSITSTQKGLQGIELGNYLIKRVVQEVQAEFPQVTKFSTLSPIPTFRLWFLEKLKSEEKGSGPSTIFTPSEIEELRSHLKCENIWEELRNICKTGGWMNNHALVEMMEAPLMRNCARYLYLEKRRGYAFDSVANFHLRNGAVMWRLNWRADLTARGLNNSYGMMVNYRYFLDETETNHRNYQEKQYIAASEQISKLATAAAELVSLPSKI
ncbi:malonyl-CoA decarboxylase, mitochondrial-like isoform X1 [Schistocerca americana]|uniref:malonyl-CoA decarboxylase, mitochondrial-like isoform X1 n=2 Tax=Schistocerca americana TaxID=7009 RepID=UPI001F4F63B1|nr:malonyl-CoA decarboxylase, mitochondrial-like isoform X1 [Schistocerca americana]